MTDITPLEKTAPLSVFLNSVCPTLPYLDDNTHFSLQGQLDEHALAEISTFTWPFTSLGAATPVKAVLDQTYLHVARPPFADPHSPESTTYVPMPLHLNTAFSKLIGEGHGLKQDGAKHVGANVNPLLHDPFRLVNLNPGCITCVMALHNHLRSNHTVPAPELQTPFNKMATSINRLLRIGNAESPDTHYFIPLPLGGEDDLAVRTGLRRLRQQLPFAPIIDFDRKAYCAKITSPTVARLVISANVSVLNVFAVDENFEYIATLSGSSTIPLIPQASALSQNAPETTSLAPTPYKKVIEKPLLRLRLLDSIIVTSMITLPKEMLVIIGLSNGDIVLINLANLTFRHFDDLGLHNPKVDSPIQASLKAVTSLNVISHPRHSILIIAGYANGEIIFLDPARAPNPSDTTYTKQVMGKDHFVTYFKLFDLSPFPLNDNTEDEGIPPYIIGHFKVSHKPITSTSSTLSNDASMNSPNDPMILAVASEDGLVRFLDFVATHGKNYGDSSKFYNLLIFTDIVSNYFQDGARCVEFSPDNKFFVVSGKGDIIEVFKVTYYNVNGLLAKNTEASQRPGRSRSGTITSNSSSNFQLLSSFLSPNTITPSSSFEMPRGGESAGAIYPLTIKDIAIVSRLKGHTNIVLRVMFMKKDQYFCPGDEKVSGKYNLISCGVDAKINLWEFNSKALPNVKKSHIVTSKLTGMTHDASLLSHLLIPNKTRPISSGHAISMHHKRTRSFNHQEDVPLGNSFSNLGINNVLNLSPQPLTLQDLSKTKEQLDIIFSLYKSLYELRLKRHYSKHKRDFRSKYACVIHGIVNDKELPSIEIPLLTMDLSCLFKNGAVSGFTCYATDLWISGKAGDVFKYTVQK